MITGPHSFNFQAEVDFLKQNNACLQISSLDELGIVIQDILNNREQRQELENNARNLMQDKTEIAQSYFSKLQGYYPSVFKKI